MEKTKWMLSVLCGMIATFAKQYYLIVVFVSLAVCFDWFTGIIGAKATGERITSKRGTIGFWKKLGLFAALFFGFFLDFFIPYCCNVINIPFPETGAVFGMIIGCYIVINECISISENIYKTNPSAVPKWIIRWLMLAKDQIDNKEESDNEREGD